MFSLLKPDLLLSSFPAGLACYSTRHEKQQVQATYEFALSQQHVHVFFFSYSIYFFIFLWRVFTTVLPSIAVK